MIRKGRPVSHAGSDADGPRDGDSTRTPSRARSFGRSPVRSSRASADQADRFERPDRSDQDDQDDQFDPFESFDAHDQASGRAPTTERTSTRTSAQTSTRTSASRRGFAAARSDPDADTPFDSPADSAAISPAETTYTRSRRQPGEPAPSKADSDSPGKSRRPVRSLKGRALGYLSRREYSRTELSRKLTPFVEEADSLESLLDSLEKEGWLSDSRFAESLLHRRSSRLGANRIVGELKRHAVDQTLIEEAGAQLRETELARAQAVWRKKFDQLPQTPAERAKQARFLAARGFSGSIIGKLLKGLDEDFADE